MNNYLHLKHLLNKMKDENSVEIICESISNIINKPICFLNDFLFIRYQSKKFNVSFKYL